MALVYNHTVYHHTTLAHWPYIAADGFFRGTKADAHYPDDFVWGTTDPRGDRTTSACRQRDIPRIRIAFDKSLFSPWRPFVLAHPDWTAQHIYALEAAAKTFRQCPDPWMVAESPVRLDLAETYEVKSWQSSWQPLERPDVGCRAVRVNGHTIEALGERWSVQRFRLDGVLRYGCIRMENEHA